jgi:AcrR family transcriptional regulator
MASPTRRERLRAEMRDEILEQARRQVADGGAEALSVNGIARAVGTSGPALYRYFASRDELLVAVAASAYDELAAAMGAALEDHRRRRPPARLRAVATAYRAWALAHPNLYRLLFGEPVASGVTAPEVLVPASHRAMVVLLDALAGLGADPGTVSPPLREQLRRWAGERDTPPASAGALVAALRAWTRLHGVVSLELQGAFASMGLDGAELYAAEVESILVA